MRQVLLALVMLSTVSANAFNPVECQGTNSRLTVVEGNHDGYSAPIQMNWIVDIEEHEGFSLGCSSSSTRSIPGMSTVYCSSDEGPSGYLFIPNVLTPSFSLRVEWDSGVAKDIPDCHPLK